MKILKKSDQATIRRIKELSKYVQGKEVLDIGCRENIMISFLPKDVNYYGLEKGSLEDNNKDKFSKFLPQGILDNDCKKIFENKKFDSIILAETLEHLPEPLTALKNINFLLKKGGKLIGSVPNGIGWRYFFFLETLGDGMSNFNNPHWDGNQHFYTFNKYVLKALLMFAGFKIKFVKEWGVWIPHTGIFLPFNKRGSHILFLVEK